MRLYEMDKSHFYVLNRVCKWAKVSILTCSYLRRVHVTKLGLVLVLMVEALHTIVSSIALTKFGTSVSFCVLAQFRCIERIISSLVFDWVKVITRLVIMWRAELRTWHPFEIVKHKVPNYDAGTVYMAPANLWDEERRIHGHVTQVWFQTNVRSAPQTLVPWC